MSDTIAGTKSALRITMNNLSLVPDAPRAGYTPLRIGAGKPVRISRPTPPELVAAPERVTIAAPAVSLATEATGEFSRWRALGGAIVGASVPTSVFVVSHTTELEKTFSSVVLWAAVVGGLVFSAGTVYAYCKKLFRDRATGTERKWKAASFCLLAETIMTFAPGYLFPLSVAMLAILVSVNAIETGRNAGVK